MYFTQINCKNQQYLALEHNFAWNSTYLSYVWRGKDLKRHQMGTVSCIWYESDNAILYESKTHLTMKSWCSVFLWIPFIVPNGTSQIMYVLVFSTFSEWWNRHTLLIMPKTWTVFMCYNTFYAKWISLVGFEDMFTEENDKHGNIHNTYIFSHLCVPFQSSESSQPYVSCPLFWEDDECQVEWLGGCQMEQMLYSFASSFII